MTDAAPLIHYATDETLDPSADRLLRRIVACAAIGYGSAAVLTTALHFALSRGWLASPPNMSWSFGGGARTVAHLLAMGALLVGGVLLLMRSRASVWLIRAGAACSIVMSALTLALLIRENPTYASYWSTPGGAAVNAFGFLQGQWLPVLLVLLTLPPLARRVV